MKRLFLIIIILLISNLIGCSYTTTIVSEEIESEYFPPGPKNFSREKVFIASFDNVWEGVISFFATANIPIKTLEKVSGIITAEKTVNSSADIQLVVDVGYLEETVQKYNKTYECNTWTLFEHEAQDDPDKVRSLCRFLDKKRVGGMDARIEKDIALDVVTIYNVFVREVGKGISVTVNTDFRVLSKTYRAESTGLFEKSLLDYIDGFLKD